MATTVYGEVTAAQLTGGSGGTGTALVGPFFTSNTGSVTPGYGLANYGYVTIGSGSLVSASLIASSGQTGTGSLAVFKNGASLATAFTNISFNSTAFKTYTVTFASNTYTFVAGDYLNFSVTASSTAFAFSATLVLSLP